MSSYRSTTLFGYERCNDPLVSLARRHRQTFATRWREDHCRGVFELPVAARISNSPWTGAGHRGVTVCRLAVARLTVFLTLVAFTAFSRCYQYPQGIKARYLLFG
jgi:hypothetical protein